MGVICKNSIFNIFLLLRMEGHEGMKISSSNKDNVLRHLSFLNVLPTLLLPSAPIGLGGRPFKPRTGLLPRSWYTFTIWDWDHTSIGSSSSGVWVTIPYVLRMACVVCGTNPNQIILSCLMFIARLVNFYRSKSVKTGKINLPVYW